MRIRLLGAELLHVDERTDRQTDRETDRQTGGQTQMTKLTAAFSNFSNAAKNRKYILPFLYLYDP